MAIPIGATEIARWETEGGRIPKPIDITKSDLPTAHPNGVPRRPCVAPGAVAQADPDGCAEIVLHPHRDAE